MSIEEQLKREILARYKSIRAFTSAIDIPYSTLDSVFKRGISNAGVSTMIKVFSALDLDLESITDNTLHSKQVIIKKSSPYSDEAMKLAADYDGHMDDRGREIVRVVADLAAKLAELERQNQELAAKVRDMEEAGSAGTPSSVAEAEALYESSSGFVPITGWYASSTTGGGPEEETTGENGGGASGSDVG